MASVAANATRSAFRRLRVASPRTLGASGAVSTASLRTAALARSFSVASRRDVKKYTEDHEWIEVDAAGQFGTLGISKYAANALGDVVFVELPTTDSHVSSGDSIGAIESVKSASDILTPVSGTVTEVNGSLEDSPGAINKSPEGDGWICKIELADKAEVDTLMDEAGYKKFTEEQDEQE